jgi:peroxiredoxin
MPRPIKVEAVFGPVRKKRVSKTSTCLVIAFALAAPFLLPVGLNAVVLPDAPDKVAPLAVGQKAPTQVLVSADGPFDLGQAIAHKPTILVFYRANWCSLGKSALTEFQDENSFFSALGFQVIAISTDTPDSLKPAAQRNQLSFPLLSDRNLSLSSAFGIAFKAPKDLADNYAKKGITLANIPGEAGSSGLLVPTVFILDNYGVVRWVYSNQKRNPSTGELITAVSKARHNIVAQSQIAGSLAAQP